MKIKQEYGMKKSNLVWGTLCLVAAAGLAAANLTLPQGDLMFQIGDKNMPWVPPVVLGIAGIIMLASGNEKEGENTVTAQDNIKPGVDSEKAALNKRLETIAWGCFLIMLGGFMFISRNRVPEGLWSIGVGLIMLGLNAARYFYKIRMSGFTTVLGILSVIGGTIQLMGIRNLEGAFLLIIIGAYLVLKPWFDKRKLFGKAEEA